MGLNIAPMLSLKAPLSGVSRLPNFSSPWFPSIGVVPREPPYRRRPSHLRKKNQAKNATKARNITPPIVAPTMIGVFEEDLGDVEVAALLVPSAVGVAVGGIV